MTKLCPHIISFQTNSEVLLDFIERTQPRIIKVVGPLGHDSMKVAEAKRRSPDSKWLLRFYLNEQPLDKPIYRAQWLAKKCKRYVDDYDIFEDYNEINPFDMELIKRYNDFSAAFGGIIHAWGKKHVTGCWSNGQPPDEMWQYMKGCVSEADYVSLHGYGWPTMSECPGLTLRYQHIYHNLLPFDRPLILSEVGMTNAVIPGQPDVGWQEWPFPVALEKKEDRAAAEWAWLLDRINEDNFVVAAMPYTTGRLQGDNWGTHDFTKRLYKLVGDYILGHPSPPEEEESEMEMPIWLNDVRATLKKHPTKKYGRRSLDKIDTIVVHHTATTSATPQAIANWHVDHNDWPGAGYHIYVRKSGQAYLMNDLSAISFHCYKHNEHTLGLAFEGDFTRESATEPQIEMGKKVVAWLADELGQLHILGHKQMPDNQTACPGEFPVSILGGIPPSPSPEDSALKRKIEELEAQLAEKDAIITRKNSVIRAARNTLNAELG